MQMDKMYGEALSFLMAGFPIACIQARIRCYLFPLLLKIIKLMIDLKKYC